MSPQSHSKNEYRLQDNCSLKMNLAIVTRPMESIEQTGNKFNLDTFLAARKLCIGITERIASLISPGLSESEGQQLIKEEFKKEGIKKFWHPSKFRIGPETVKNFREPSDESVRLSTTDIFFLDVGPIIEDHEADYGKTYVLITGDQKDMPLSLLAEAPVRIWKETADQWRLRGLSGVNLYKFAEDTASSLGYILNPLMAGHRLGDFPHALFSKEKLFSMDVVPRENLWVLEIHVVDPILQRGAFFEDILS